MDTNKTLREHYKQLQQGFSDAQIHPDPAQWREPMLYLMLDAIELNIRLARFPPDEPADVLVLTAPIRTLIDEIGIYYHERHEEDPSPILNGDDRLQRH